ncbi:MAG: histidinol-phosphate transaminase [Oscillospiraceae bacterium]|nr:histidinol-phosphate transaminase [Oscillospiraceae bacterium]
MSKFFSEKYKSLEPYVPGEQPKDTVYIKLNTNESPFPPCEEVIRASKDAASDLQLYPDPDCSELIKKLAEVYGVSTDEITVNNGSDETLNFAFMAYCDKSHPAVFPDITYGFYPVFAQINGIPYEEIPLESDFSININKYKGINKTVFIANPNAPTGIALNLEQIEEILSSNPDNIVVIDEAYVDFGAKSAVKLIHKYNNLLVTQTFSKSRSMAGARLGFGIANKDIIADLNAVKYSTNPYNINRVTAAAGVAALKNESYTIENCKKIEENREYTSENLKELGFICTPSRANFIFAKSPKIGGKELYLELKKRGVLIRHFEKERIKDYNRITVGSKEQMDILLERIKEIL